MGIVKRTRTRLLHLFNNVLRNVLYNVLHVFYRDKSAMSFYRSAESESNVIQIGIVKRTRTELLYLFNNVLHMV